MSMTASKPGLFGGGSQRTLLLVVAVPLILIAALGIRMGFEQLNKQQQALLKSDLELIARAIRIPVGEALARGDTEGVSLALQSLFTIDRVYGVSVFDREGRRLASVGIAEQDLSQSVIPRQIDLTGEKQEAYRRVGGRRVFSHFLPLFDGSGQSEGFIQITRRYDDFKKALWHLTWISWLLWAMLALAIVLVVIAGYRSGIGRHVDKLLAVMDRVARGERSQRAAVNGPRDVAQIASGLNRMLDSVAEYEHKIQAHQLSERRLLLQLKDKEKMAIVGTMARGFAHELGAPLSVISGRAQRLRRLLDGAGEYELAEIERQVQHLTQTVNQLLDYSRPGIHTRRQFVIDTVIQHVQELLLPLGDAQELQLRFAVEEGLPPLQGDPERLQLALLSVVRNARQAARSWVQLRVSGDSEALTIAVEDDGPGLPDLPAEQLIEPFFTTKPSGDGTGLGLSIAEGIVREHGGSLKLSNRREGGARVSLVLPWHAPEETDHD